MTDAIKDYIAKMPKHEHWGWQWIKEVRNADHLKGKISNPFHKEESVATFFLVGEDSVETDEETGETTDTFTITHLEFLDWGILPDDDDEEAEELSDDQIAEIVQDTVLGLLDLEIGEHEHAFYYDYIGVNLYRAPLKNAIVVVRQGNEVTLT